MNDNVNAAVVFKESTGQYGIRLLKELKNTTFEGRERYVIVGHSKECPELIVDDEEFKEMAQVTISQGLEKVIIDMANSWHRLNGWGGYINVRIVDAQKKFAEVV